MQHNTSQPVRPLVSCLMVTQKGRFKEIQQSINCFFQQHLQPIELVIVHDSGSAFHERLFNLANEYPEADIQIHHEPEGHTLGWLRNRSIQHANGELVCQWDDDDLNHPSRLKVQYDLMCDEGTDFCFMTDQLHLFTEQGFLFWDDWRNRPRPHDLIENTLLGKRELICHYPNLKKGEDTAIIDHIADNGFQVSRLQGMGWLYIYIYNNKNTWDFKHHSEISMHLRQNTAELLAARDILEKELNQYQLPFDCLYMPHDDGKLEFKL